MGISKEQAISQFGSESYTAWDEAGAKADATAKGLIDSSGNLINKSYSLSTSGSGDLPAYLQKFQETAMQSLSSLKPAEVPTFDELKNNLTPDYAAPTALNRVESRELKTTALGIPELETELNTIKDEEALIVDDLRALTGTEEGKPVAMNVISGRITEEERVAQTRLDAVIRRKNSAINELTTKYNVVNTYVSDLGLDYQDAVTAYNNDFDRNYKVQSMITDMSNNAFSQSVDLIKTGFDVTLSTAEFAEKIKQSNIDNARANLTTMANAITSGNTTYENMSSDQKLQIQKLEIQSGMPVGTVSSLQLSNKDKIISTSTSNGVTSIIMMGADGQPTIKKIGTSTESTSVASTKALDADISKGIQLDQAMTKYRALGLSPDTILSHYNNLSPAGQAKESADVLKSKYNVTGTSTKSTISNANINEAIQLATNNGATAEEIKQIKDNPDAYVNDIIALYGD